MSNLRRFLARFLRDGDADEAVEAFINKTLDYNPDVKCSHHEHRKDREAREKADTTRA